MKKIIIPIALLAVLSTISVGCQKEEITEPLFPILEVETIRAVHYIIDGKEYQVSIIGNNAWDDFIQNMCMLSYNGHEVFFYDANANQIESKETVTFSTKSESEAIAWCDKKFEEGYGITIKYDEKTNTYNCYAIR